MIPYGKQTIDEDDIQAVVDVLKSDFLTQGPATPAFEKALADYAGAKHALAVNSATSALIIACRALELGPGDILWTSPITFVASANAGLHCGADIDFVDVEPDTANICVKAMAQKLEKAEQEGKLPKVVMPVHFAGQSCDMAGIAALAEQYGFSVIEDASHAVGGQYRNNYVGACEYSDITVYSFHPVKNLTTGEGGCSLTNDPKLAQSMDLWRSHGVTRNPELMEGDSDGPWYYQQVELGYNFRITDIQSALGHSQLRKLDDFVAKRRALAKRYDSLLEGLPVTPLKDKPDAFSARHLYMVRVDQEACGRSRKEVFQSMRDQGIGVNVHYIPVHTQPYFKELGFKEGDFPEAESYYAEAITLPLFPLMTEEQQDQVVTALTLSLGL